MFNGHLRSQILRLRYLPRFLSTRFNNLGDPARGSDDMGGAQLAMWPSPIYSRCGKIRSYQQFANPTRDTTFFLNQYLFPLELRAPNGFFSIAMMLVAFGYVKGIQ